jgi:alkylation response protein AidB-like acyl-CoA dehydrogenase
MNFGSKFLQDKCVKDCLQGKKFICLAITEPYAGSDVAGMRTTAVKDPSGKFYVVNGEKKWCVARCRVTLHSVVCAVCVCVQALTRRPACVAGL